MRAGGLLLNSGFSAGMCGGGCRVRACPWRRTRTDLLVDATKVEALRLPTLRRMNAGGVIPDDTGMGETRKMRGLTQAREILTNRFDIEELPCRGEGPAAAQPRARFHQRQRVLVWSSHTWCVKAL